MATAAIRDERLVADRLVPPAIRRPAAVLAVLCAAGFLALAVHYRGTVSAGRLDSRLFALLPSASGSGAVDELAAIAPLVAFGVALLGTTAMLVTRRWRAAVLVAAGPAVTMLVAEVAKRIVDRRLDGYFALPSGHTAGVTSVALAAVVVLLGRSRAHVVRVAVLGWVVTTLFGAGIALVMVAVHGHYPTDTVAGYCVAVAVTLGVAFGVDRWGRRRLR